MENKLIEMTQKEIENTKKANLIFIIKEGEVKPIISGYYNHLNKMIEYNIPGYTSPYYIDPTETPIYRLAGERFEVKCSPKDGEWWKCKQFAGDSKRREYIRVLYFNGGNWFYSDSALKNNYIIENVTPVCKMCESNPLKEEH